MCVGGDRGDPGGEVVKFLQVLTVGNLEAEGKLHIKQVEKYACFTQINLPDENIFNTTSLKLYTKTI